MVDRHGHGELAWSPGAAAGPFAIQHFNRVANYGVFANLTADFVASVLLMPTLAITLLVQAMGHEFGLGDAAALAGRRGGQGDHLSGARLRCGSRGQPRTLECARDCARDFVPWHCLRLPLERSAALDRPADVGGSGPVAQAGAFPVAWIAADGDDAAIVVAGKEIPMKPGARLYATGLWAQRRGFTLASDSEATAAGVYDCNRKGCLPRGAGRPAIAASWMRKPPAADRFASLCDRADIVILRSLSAPDGPCGDAIVLTRADFQSGGAAEVFADKTRWRLVWSQPLRGHRPWTGAP